MKIKQLAEKLKDFDEDWEIIDVEDYSLLEVLGDDEDFTVLFVFGQEF